MPKAEHMPTNLRNGAAQISGTNMADVRVHTNSAQPRQMQAQAYAQGNQVHVGTGQAKNLPHEMSHVVQQRQGRVAPTGGAAGIANVGRK